MVGQIQGLSLFTTQVPWFEILLRTAVVYFSVLIGLRLTGKRQIGQMSPFDLVLLLLISNAVQNAMTGPDTSVFGGIIAAVTLLLLNFSMAFLAHYNKGLDHLVEGTATLLINNGVIIEKHLLKETISHEELYQALREHGILNLEEVRLAVLEVDGSISVIKNEDVAREFQTKPHRFRYLKKHSS